MQVESGKPYTETAPQQTAAAPADGSPYVPKVGDVIRCDDGTDYTLKMCPAGIKTLFPAHRWENCLPPPATGASCPQPEMPQAEARHFTSGGQDYLFQRNIYETRRMLYTLYNTIGDNPETWQNGQPVKFPSGNDKVNINLTIPAEATPQSFCPWRAEQITELFDSCPPETYFKHHPNIKLTTDGKAKPYVHKPQGAPDYALPDLPYAFKSLDDYEFIDMEDTEHESEQEEPLKTNGAE